MARGIGRAGTGTADHIHSGWTPVHRGGGSRRPVCLLFTERTMKKFALLSVLFSSAVWAGSWPTYGGDAQRSGWAKDETQISADSIKQFKLLWKLKLENEPKELNNLTPPIAINPVYTDAGAKSLVV